MKIKNILLSSLLVSSTLFAGGDLSQPSFMSEEVKVQPSWQTSASLYMLGAGIAGETATQGDIDITFEDIMDNFEMGFMGNIATNNGQWGFEADVLYMNLGNDLEDNRLIKSFDFSSWIVTTMATYKILETPKLDLHLLAGARYFSMEPKLNDISTSGDIWDGIIGIKGKYSLNEQWFIPFHADIGTGDSESTWQGFAGLGYKYDNMDIIAGYRYIEWNFDESHPAGDVFNDVSISGPMLGIKFHF
jgi:opacity protein-like surface antigen